MNNNNTNFLLGLSTGVAVVALLGFLVMAGLYFSQGNNTNLAAVTGDTSTGQGDTGTSTGTTTQVEAGSNIRGNSEAKVTIVEFSDFQCPFCQRFHGTVQQALDKYGDQVNWAYRHFPLDSIHPQARPAAEASECAAEQDKFWEFADAMFASQSSLGNSFYTQVAQNIGLDVSQFDSCVSERKYKDKVEADYRAGIEAGVRGTPGSFVNGKLVSGAVPFATLQAEIDQALAN